MKYCFFFSMEACSFLDTPILDITIKHEFFRALVWLVTFMFGYFRFSFAWPLALFLLLMIEQGWRQTMLTDHLPAVFLLGYFSFSPAWLLTGFVHQYWQQNKLSRLAAGKRAARFTPHTAAQQLPAWCLFPDKVD